MEKLWYHMIIQIENIISKCLFVTSKENSQLEGNILLIERENLNFKWLFSQFQLEKDKITIICIWQIANLIGKLLNDIYK